MKTGWKCVVLVPLLLALNGCGSMEHKDSRLLCALFGAAVGAGLGAWADQEEAAIGVGAAGAAAGYYACGKTAPDPSKPTGAERR